MEKLTFNEFTRIMSVVGGVTDLDIKQDVYSGWKRWALLAQNNKYKAIRSIGGDITKAPFKAGDIYFLINGWRLQIDMTLTAVNGALFSDDFNTPLIDFSGNPVNTFFVSNLVTGVSNTNSGITEQDKDDIADKSKVAILGTETFP